MKKVCLDAGHGGSAPGSVSYFNGITYLEKEAALKITLGIDKYLRRCSFTTVMTRTDDIFVSFEDRVKIASDNKCDLFVSIHMNGHDSNAKGFEVFHHPSSSASSKQAAKSVYDDFMQAFPSRKGRGVKAANFYVLRNLHAKMPAILIEVGFITNQEEAKWIYSNIDKISKTLARAIEDI